ncbi:MAG: MarR family transcriptional regulator [Pseudomonadota bacterium]|nr:MarR family transcriptional regulator [Pseudomonadota bacterium]
MPDTARQPDVPVPPFEPYRAVTRLIERLHRLYLDVIRADLGRMGIEDISAVQALLLTNIGSAEVNVRTLMERGYYQGSNASYNLKKLVETGYLEQFRSPHDRRATIVRLTDKGHDLTRRFEALETTFAKDFDGEGGAFRTMIDQLTNLERDWTDYIRFGPRS